MSIDLIFFFLLILFPLVLHPPPTTIPLTCISDAFSVSSIKMCAEPLAEILWNSFLAGEDNTVLGSLPDSVPH